MRGSKKLQSLETNSHKKLEFANDRTMNEKIIDMGYSNKCYVASDVSYRENLDKCDSEAIRKFYSADLFILYLGMTRWISIISKKHTKMIGVICAHAFLPIAQSTDNIFGNNNDTCDGAFL